MNSKKRLTRRDALKLFALTSQGVFAAPSLYGLGAITASLVQKALANSNPALNLARNLVTFQISGAPPRWMWEPINPYDSSGRIVGNRNAVNRYSGAADNRIAEYLTLPLHGINMPLIWHSDLPGTSGTRPMSELMEHMLMIRGVNVVNPDHTGALEKQFRPGGIPHTITSLSGDANSQPIPFVGMDTTPNPYSSKLNKAGVVSLNLSGNWLENLLRPFIVNAPAFNAKLAPQLSLIEQLNRYVSDLLSEISDNFSAPGSAQRDALSLIQRNFSNIASEFTTLRDKYRSLLRLATAPVPIEGVPFTNIEGINDQPVMLAGADLRETLRAAQLPHYIWRMSEQFAVIEYSLINGLSPSLAAGLKPFTGQNFDEHEEVPTKSILYNALWNRGFAACLLELIDVLKQNSLWDKTVVTIAAEFGRNPKGAGNGSDHAPQATSMTYFSGCLKGYEVVGNTRDSTSTVYPGTWGVGADNGAGIGTLSSGHIASTTAALLGVASPATSSPSLVKFEGGKFVSLVPPSKIIG